MGLVCKIDAGQGPFLFIREYSNSAVCGQDVFV